LSINIVNRPLVVRREFRCALFPPVRVCSPYLVLEWRLQWQSESCVSALIERGEGVRIGAVRRPPRGVRKSEYASQNWYDVWLPNVAPTSELMKLGRLVESEKDWAAFEKKYRAEMADPEKSRILDLLAALSHDANFSVGCYCENEARCHRSILRKLLAQRGAKLE